MDKQKTIAKLNLIIMDCEQDAKDFDGKPFNGKTLGELHGILEAKISAIAEILKELVEQND